MKYKVGDKVKFLDQKGGGIVAKIVSSQIVNVMGEDGFEIPTLAKDILKVEEENASAASKMFMEPDVHYAGYNAVSEPVESVGQVSALKKNDRSNTQPEGIFLTFVPQEQSWLLLGELDIFLVNHSPYELICQLCTKKNRSYVRWGIYTIPPYTKYLVTSIDREDLSQWEEGVLQILFYNEQEEKMVIPVSNEFQIKGSRFYKESNYQYFSCIDEKAISYTIQGINALSFLGQTKEKQTTPISRAHLKINNSEDILEKHLINKTTAEVDLHIDALFEDAHLLQKNELLSKQMSYFISCLEFAIHRNLQKVIFIHGVGSGVLKEGIHKELKKYKGLHWFDASIAKYGVGATEVLFGQNAQER